MPSVTCLRPCDASVICRVTYFPFPIQSAFLPCQSARQHRGVLDLPNIGHRTLPKIWVGFLYGAYLPGDHDFELILILTVKLETRHPVEGSFGSELPAICNRRHGYSGHEVASRWNFGRNFCDYLGKTTPYGKSLKILFRKFSSRHWSTVLCSNVVKFVRLEIGEIMCYLVDNKKIACLSNCRYCADRAQNLPRLAPNNVLTLIQISCISVHFRRSYSRTREHRQIAT